LAPVEPEGNGIVEHPGDPSGTDASARLLLALTKLYVQRSNHTAHEQQQYTELALGLIDRAGATARAAAAARLDGQADAPAAVIERLADGARFSPDGGRDDSEPPGPEDLLTRRHSAEQGPLDGDLSPALSGRQPPDQEGEHGQDQQPVGGELLSPEFGEAFFAASSVERRRMLSAIAGTGKAAPDNGKDARRAPSFRAGDRRAIGEAGCVHSPPKCTEGADISKSNQPSIDGSRSLQSWLPAEGKSSPRKAMTEPAPTFRETGRTGRNPGQPVSGVSDQEAEKGTVTSARGQSRSSENSAEAAQDVGCRTRSHSQRAKDSGGEAEAPAFTQGRLHRRFHVRIDVAPWRARTGAFAGDFGRLIDAPKSLSERILNDPSGEPMVIAARATGMPVAVLQRILVLVSPAAHHSVQRVYELTELYHAVADDTARGLLAVWRMAASKDAGSGVQTAPAPITNMGTRFRALNARIESKAVTLRCGPGNAGRCGPPSR
jgi:hypothetical protein